MFLFIGYGLLAQSPKEILSSVLAQSAFEDADLGIMVKNFTTDEILISHQPNKTLSPASILKIKTAAAALTKWNPQHKFKTVVFLTGHVSDGVLYGDIVIKGFGDPTFHSSMDGATSLQKVNRDVLAELSRMQVSCVFGSVIGDASYFSLPGVPAGYMQEDVANYYGAGAFGLNVQDNAYNIRFNRHKNGAVNIKEFDSLAIDFITSAVKAEGRSDQAYIYYHPDPTGVHVIGKIPTGVGAFKIKGALRNPPLYAAKTLQSLLENDGIEFQENASALWTPYILKGDVLSSKEYFSPPMITILKPILHKSNNLYAEVLYRHLITEEAFDVDGDDMLFDGSGLSPENRISADELMKILETISKSSHLKDFLSVLPKNGLDGTVKSVVKNKPGQLFVKSGSIGGVRSYMGLRQNKSGEWIGFVCMANELTCSGTASRQAWETLLTWVADL